MPEGVWLNQPVNYHRLTEHPKFNTFKLGNLQHIGSMSTEGTKSIRGGGSGRNYKTLAKIMVF